MQAEKPVFSSENYFSQNVKSMKVVSFIMIAIGVGFSFWLGVISIEGAITSIIVTSLFGLVLYFVAWIQGLTYVLVFPDRVKVRDEWRVWRWYTIPLDDLEDVDTSASPFYKILIFSNPDQITIFSQHLKPYTLREPFIMNMTSLFVMLKEQVERRGKAQGRQAARCDTCMASTPARRCFTCGRFSCPDCMDAHECLICRMNRMLGRSAFCILLSLLAALAFDCIAIWKGFEYYSFISCLFTGFSTFPFGMASLLAAMTILQPCRVQLHDTKAVGRLLARTMILCIVASFLVFFKIVYYTLVLASKDSVLRGLMAGELGIAGIFFIATFAITRFKSTNRDLIVQKTWNVILWAFFFTTCSNFISQMLIMLLPGEMITTAAMIVGIASLAVIILAVLYMAGVKIKRS
jgi:hypothetical protein